MGISRIGVAGRWRFLMGGFFLARAAIFRRGFVGLGIILMVRFGRIVLLGGIFIFIFIISFGAFDVDIFALLIKAHTLFHCFDTQ